MQPLNLLDRWRTRGRLSILGRRLELALVGMACFVSIAEPRTAQACSPFHVGLSLSVADENRFDNLPANLPLNFDAWAYESSWTEIQSQLEIRVWSDQLGGPLAGSLYWWPNDISQDDFRTYGFVSWVPDEPFAVDDDLRIEIEVKSEADGAVDRVELFGRTTEPIELLHPPPKVAAASLSESLSTVEQWACCETGVDDSCGNTIHCEPFKQWVQPTVKFFTEPMGPAVVRVHQLDEDRHPVQHTTVMRNEGTEQLVQSVVFPERQAEYCVQLEVLAFTATESKMGEVFCVPHANADTPRLDTLGEPRELLESGGSVQCIDSIYDRDTDEVLVNYPFDEPAGCACEVGSSNGASGSAWLVLLAATTFAASRPRRLPA